MSTLARIEKLIALTASESEHEARSAAYLACKLIREGGFRVVAREAERTEDPFAAAGWRPWPSPPRRPPSPPRPPPDLRPRRVVASTIARARRSGVCAVCGEDVEEGSDVALPSAPADASLGVAHADCRARWTVPVAL
ncbi:MAG: hypothetical protein JWP97_2829 [Labilithrix sp.]|nr:hypothetical protein [Labilithrix sp.]